MRFMTDARPPDRARGRWFCRQCGRPLNRGFSWDGLCVICAEPFLNPEFDWEDPTHADCP
jgi:hypothetical protein